MLPVGNETEILPVAADACYLLTMEDEKWPEYFFFGGRRRHYYVKNTIKKIKDFILFFLTCQAMTYFSLIISYKNPIKFTCV